MRWDMGGGRRTDGRVGDGEQSSLLAAARRRSRGQGLHPPRIVCMSSQPLDSVQPAARDMRACMCC
jgi:hypothetical protein